MVITSRFQECLVITNVFESTGIIDREDFTHTNRLKFKDALTSIFNGNRRGDRAVLALTEAFGIITPILSKHNIRAVV